MTHPANGVRFELSLISNEAGSAHYRGHAFLATASVAIEIKTTAAVATTTLGESQGEVDRGAIEKLATALVRAATRVELAKGEPIPSKIVRWRPLER